jgi:hypothetical protein
MQDYVLFLPGIVIRTEQKLFMKHFKSYNKSKFSKWA